MYFCDWWLTNQNVFVTLVLVGGPKTHTHDNFRHPSTHIVTGHEHGDHVRGDEQDVHHDEHGGGYDE